MSIQDLKNKYTEEIIRQVINPDVFVYLDLLIELSDILEISDLTPYIEKYKYCESRLGILNSVLWSWLKTKGEIWTNDIVKFEEHNEDTPYGKEIRTISVYLLNKSSILRNLKSVWVYENYEKVREAMDPNNSVYLKLLEIKYHDWNKKGRSDSN